MDVLLTGATGLIGPHVLQRLLERGDRVRVLALPETVDRLPRHDRLRVLQGNLESTDTLAAAAASVDVIYHLAGLLTGRESRDLVRTNVRGTENVVRAGVQGGMRRFVFTSSVAVYRSPGALPDVSLAEEAPRGAHGPEHLRAYARSKIDAEDLVVAAHRRHGFEYVILRLSTVYGPGAPFAERLLEQALRFPWRTLSMGEPFGAMQWVHVDDLADAVVAAGTEAGAANEAFNIAGDEPVTLRRLVATARGGGAPAGPRAARAPGRGRPGEGAFLRFDTSKARRLLGFTPKVPLREGLSDMLVDVRSGARTGRRPPRRIFRPAR